jgi:hypothetical protein
MKIIKFRDYLVPLVLSKQKTSTWRLFDDKDLSVGDDIELREFGKDQSFGIAIITKVIEKPLGKLTNEDKVGHESFSSDEEMYKTYQTYYNTQVSPETIVKIIWFTLK